MRTRALLLYPPIVLIAATMLFSTGCDNDFSPKSDFESKIAVFCILDPVQEVQTVVVARSYDAELGISLQPLTSKEVEGATVRIYGEGKTFDFKDTLVTLDDGGTRTAWISRELVPKPGLNYRLQIDVPEEPQLKASISQPPRIYVQAKRTRPDTGDGHVRVYPAATGFPVPPDAYYFRLFVETWKLLPSGDTIKPRLEVPIYSSPGGGGWVYSAPSRAMEAAFLPGVVRQFVDANEQPADSVLSRRCIVKGYAMDRPFYSYYKIVRGFDDPRTVRLDLPDVSFIEGGLGVFGAVTPDSTQYSVFLFTN
ncbi:DUF4249 domain-containing protein [bacterium]|nr:DUF4249 domain-containing protein [bacterium]